MSDEFDELLDQSSVGTPNAKAIQALTPPDVMKALEDHLKERRDSATTD